MVDVEVVGASVVDVEVTTTRIALRVGCGGASDEAAIRPRIKRPVVVIPIAQAAIRGIPVA